MHRMTRNDMVQVNSTYQELVICRRGMEAQPLRYWKVPLEAFLKANFRPNASIARSDGGFLFSLCGFISWVILRKIRARCVRKGGRNWWRKESSQKYTGKMDVTERQEF